MAVDEISRLLSAIFAKRSRLSKTEHRAVSTSFSSRERLHWAVEGSCTNTLEALGGVAAIDVNTMAMPSTYRWNAGDYWNVT